jgi:hypothetical protein
MRIISRSLSALVLLGLVAAGCGGKDGSEVNGGSGDGKGASASGGSLSLDPGNGSLGANNSGTVVDPDSACAKGTASANLAGVNMFVMFDRSSSMNESAQRNGPSRWQLTSTALSSFFASPDAAGLNVALRFFPHDMPAAGCNQDGCDTNACATPLVALGTLSADMAPADAQEKLLLDATVAAAPGMAGQGTPISAALSGAYQWASAQHTKTPNENTVVVLVTDGEPNGCDTDIGNISGLAAAALAKDGTRTYAIGLTGSQERDMDQIAMAGGTTKGIFVADGANTTQDLVNALADIRGAILDCDFAMPVPKPGLAVEVGFINVNFTPGGGKTATLPQVANEGSCAATPGWYYDNPVNPSRIILCKSTCDTVTGDPMASLEILLGCQTSTEDPR